ncbi:MAG: PAS domain S-box protein [Bacteroidales bacterium]
MVYKLEDFIDIPLLQDLQEKLNVIYSFPSAIIDNNGKILTSVAWQGICTEFHRTNPDCEKECIKSNQYILKHINEANPFVSYSCSNGMIDNAVPIIIDGNHLGNFFTGQFFLEEPDIDFFRMQAQKYGFDEEAYIEAVKKVPIWSKDKMNQYHDFVKSFIDIIVGLSHKQIQILEINQLIKESEKFNRTILQCTSDWIWEVDEESKYIYCSGKVEQILGYTSEEIIGKTPFDLMPDEEKEDIKEKYKKIYENNISIVDLENWNLHKDGHRVCLLTNGYPVFDGKGKIIGYRGADKDITERKHDEEKLNNLNRLYSILNTTNHSILKIKDKQQLYNEICNIAIDKGSFRMAWVGLLDETTHKVIPVASAGFTNDYLTDINIDLSVPHLSAGPTGLAFKTASHQIVTNIEANPDMIPWMEKAIKNQYFSSSSFPIIVFGKVIGAFSLYADKTYFFNEDEVNLLDLLTNDISKAIEFIEIEQRNQETLQRLKESEQKYRKIFENIQDVFYQIDLNGIIIDISPSISKFCEYSREDVLGTEVCSYYYDLDDKERFLNTIKQLGSVYDYELNFKSKSGRKIFSSISAQITYDLNGKLSHIEGILRDISERKQAQESIKSEKERLSVIIQGTKTATWEWNIQTGATVFNDRWAEIIGYTIEEISPYSIRTWEKITHPDDLKISAEKLAKHFSGELDYYDCEVRMQHKNGNWIWVLDRGIVNKRDENGKPLIMSGTHQDITEQKLAEKILKESEYKLKNIFNNLQDAFFQVDINGKFTLVSPSAVLMYAYNSENEMLGLPAENLYANPLDREELIRLLSTIGKLEDFICQAKRKDGSTFWASMNVQILYDENAQFLGTVGVVRDISERKRAEEEMLSSKQIIEGIMNSIPVRVFWKDKNLVYLGCNAAFAKDAGFSDPTDIIGKNDFQLSWSSHADDYRKDDQQVINTKIPKLNIEEELTNSKGDKIFLLTSKIPLLNAEGEVEGVLGTFNDISEKKQAEDEMQIRESCLSAIIENQPGLMWLKDLSGKFLIVNNKFSISAGIDNPALLIGKTDFDFWPNELAEKYISDDNKVIDSKEHYIIEEPILDSGVIKWFETFKAPIIDVEGKVIGTTGYSRDISERKQIEEKIHEKDIQFRKLSSNVPDLIYQFTRRIDGTYCVPIASEGIKNIFGCSPEDVIDDFTPIAKVIYPEDAERVINDIEYSAAHLTYFSCEFRVQIPGKPIQWIYSRSSPEKLPDGSITWYGFNVDITERKQIEMELFKAKEKAEESDRLKMAFLKNISHEIRTPFNGLLGFLSIIQENDVKPSERDRYIQIINKNAERLLSTINDIVEIAKIDAGQANIRISDFNLNSFIDDLFYRYDKEFENTNVAFLLNNTLFDKQFIIQTDRSVLNTVLCNLINNALKFTKQGTVELGCRLASEDDHLNSNETTEIEFYVKDTGIGISEDKQNLIFNRFTQADISDTRAYEGSGLGLSIAKAYVELLGGQIWLESKPVKGSTFYFTLPCRTYNLNEKVDEITISNELISFKKLKILIVEDDEISMKLMSQMLKKYSKSVLKAGSGIEAIEIARNTPDIDLILMDIKMPDMNGYIASKHIRKFNKNVIIIAQTAYVYSNDREKATEAGCNDYIKKPIRLEQLKKILNNHFQD